MSPSRAARHASKLLADDITSRILKDGTVELGWEHLEQVTIHDRRGRLFDTWRWQKVFDVMGRGRWAEEALEDLIDQMSFVEWEPVRDSDAMTWEHDPLQRIQPPIQFGAPMSSDVVDVQCASCPFRFATPAEIEIAARFLDWPCHMEREYRCRGHVERVINASNSTQGRE